jgi:hypothetical protein
MRLGAKNVTGRYWIRPPPRILREFASFAYSRHGKRHAGSWERTNPLVLELLAIWSDLPPNRQLELLAITHGMLASLTYAVNR